MDPNVRLAQLRETLATAAASAHTDSPDVLRSTLGEVGELVDGLDEWLRRGGFAPQAWPLVTENVVRRTSTDAALWVQTNCGNDDRAVAICDLMVNLIVAWLFNHSVEPGDAIHAIMVNYDEPPVAVLERASVGGTRT